MRRLAADHQLDDLVVAARALGEGLDVPAVAEHRAGVGERLDLVHAVRDVEEGQALVPQPRRMRIDVLHVAAVSAEVASSRIRSLGSRPSALANSTICRRDSRLLDRAVAVDLRRSPVASTRSRSRPSSSSLPGSLLARARAARARAGRGDASPAELETLGLAVASLPVYRTYVDANEGRVTDEDRLAIDAATMAPAIAEMLLLERPAPAGFVTRFQQTTPAVMAKGVEDTAFYRYGSVAGAQRRRRRPRPLRYQRGPLPPRGMSSAAVRFPLNLLPRRRTTPSARATCARGLPWLASMPEERQCTSRALAPNSPEPRARAGRRRVERYFVFQTPGWSLADRGGAGSSPMSKRRCGKRSATRAGYRRTPTGRAR